MKTAAAGMGGAMLLPGCTAAPKRWRFFTREEADLVIAVAEQIIPADEDPGATDAGVINFIDRQLTGRHAKHQQRYRKGLAGVQQTSREMYGKDFLSLARDEQTALLEALEADNAPGQTWETVSASSFFGTIVDHAMQGFYGSPIHGGNRDYVSYRMLDLDYPVILGRNRTGGTRSRVS